MNQDHVHLIISLLCISQLALLQAVLRLKVRIYRLEEENGQKKGQNKEI
jgi:hypothetical protein